jgi:hypothetical protein
MNLRTRKEMLAVCGVLCAATQLLAPGAAAQTLTTIHTFTGGPNDGANPASPVLISASGRLYGVTWYGGPPGCFYGCGTVFSLTPPSPPGGAWPESVYDFQGVTSVEYPTGRDGGHIRTPDSWLKYFLHGPTGRADLSATIRNTAATRHPFRFSRISASAEE